MILQVRCGLGWGEAEIQNIPLSYDEGVVEWVVSSVEGLPLRIGKVCLWLNQYYFTYSAFNRLAIGRPAPLPYRKKVVGSGDRIIFT